MNRKTDFVFENALNYLKQFNGKTIVEIGSIRALDKAESDGHSTLHWAKSGYPTWSVDESSEAVKLTAQLLKDYCNVTLIYREGINFLKAFPDKIDLLYLDGPNSPKWALEAFKAANLSNKSIVLIDDADLEDLGKAKLVIEEALSKGFELISLSRQALLIKQ